jgi:hypothetical protein
MDGSARYGGNPTGLRYAAYFVLFIGTLFGLATLGIAYQEYRARDAWPIAWGEVLSSEEHSRVVRGSSGPNSTVYWIRFTVVFDPPLDRCRPGMLWITAGGPTRCVGTFNTLEGSRMDAYQWTRRHPVQSHVQVHYEPHGTGVRFAGESVIDTYPWEKVFVIFVIFFVGFGLLRFARWLEENGVESRAAASAEPEDAPRGDELIDLKLR